MGLLLGTCRGIEQMVRWRLILADMEAAERSPPTLTLPLKGGGDGRKRLSVVSIIIAQPLRGGRCGKRRSKMISAMRFFIISGEPPAIIQPRVRRKQYSTRQSWL